MEAEKERNKRKMEIVGLSLSVVGQKRRDQYRCNQDRHGWTVKGGSILELLCRQLDELLSIEDKLW